MNEITINGEVYVKKADIEQMAVSAEGLEYVIIRTYSAGVHAGYLYEHSGKEVTLLDARRLWKWAGAFTLSEISRFGVKKPEECRFSCTIAKITLTEAIEILYATEAARESIQGVKDYDC